VNPPRVFVYGTLRDGEPNHRLLKGATRLGTWRTEAAFSMFDLGAYPGVRPGGSTAVAGEVYRVTPQLLARLDRLEDYPRLYDRKPIRTRFGSAWIYLLRRRPTGAPPVPSGCWPKTGNGKAGRPPPGGAPRD